jgi:hypothetical protein
MKRGEQFVSLIEIREALHWKVGYRKMMYTEDQMKKAMKLLRSHHMIASTKAPRGMVISICNYSKYQDPQNYEGTNEGTNEGTRQARPLTRRIRRKEKQVDKTSLEYRFASSMFDKIKDRYPGTKEPNLEKWADHIRLAVERDQRDIKEMWHLFLWAHDDEFWSPNILSTSSLRKNYDKLFAKRTSCVISNVPPLPKFNEDAL